MKTFRDRVASACRFYDLWFLTEAGELQESQEFWFSARKPSHRALFDAYCRVFGPELRAIVEEVGVQCGVSVGIDRLAVNDKLDDAVNDKLAGFSGTEAVKVAIFLDQMVRNIEAMVGHDEEKLIEFLSEDESEQIVQRRSDATHVIQAEMSKILQKHVEKTSGPAANQATNADLGSDLRRPIGDKPATIADTPDCKTNEISGLQLCTGDSKQLGISTESVLLQMDSDVTSDDIAADVSGMLELPRWLPRRGEADYSASTNGEDHASLQHVLESFCTSRSGAARVDATSRVAKTVTSSVAGPGGVPPFVISMSELKKTTDAIAYSVVRQVWFAIVSVSATQRDATTLFRSLDGAYPHLDAENVNEESDEEDKEGELAAKGSLKEKKAQAVLAKPFGPKKQQVGSRETENTSHREGGKGLLSALGSTTALQLGACMRGSDHSFLMRFSENFAVDLFAELGVWGSCFFSLVFRHQRVPEAFEAAKGVMLMAMDQCIDRNLVELFRKSKVFVKGAVSNWIRRSVENSVVDSVEEFDNCSEWETLSTFLKRREHHDHQSDATTTPDGKSNDIESNGTVVCEVETSWAVQLAMIAVNQTDTNLAVLEKRVSLRMEKIMDIFRQHGTLTKCLHTFQEFLVKHLDTLRCLRCEAYVSRAMNVDTVRRFTIDDDSSGGTTASSSPPALQAASTTSTAIMDTCYLDAMCIDYRLIEFRSHLSKDGLLKSIEAAGMRPFLHMEDLENDLTVSGNADGVRCARVAHDSSQIYLSNRNQTEGKQREEKNHVRLENLLASSASCSLVSSLGASLVDARTRPHDVFAPLFGGIGSAHDTNPNLSYLKQHPLVQSFREQIAMETEYNLFTNADCGYVLSLSGGVDSIVHCCILSILQDEFKGKVCALHLRHANRREQVHEEEWVGFLATKLGISLYCYTVELQRPHGIKKTGLSRERYEEATKDIRFRMYQRCYEKMGTSLNCVIIGHHQDDVDENRITELGKGTLVHIDGIKKWVGIDLNNSKAPTTVQLCRPLLMHRKQEFFHFASYHHLCYMRDSTPYWSRRGWIRRTLDWINQIENPWDKNLTLKNPWVIYEDKDPQYKSVNTIREVLSRLPRKLPGSEAAQSDEGSAADSPKSEENQMALSHYEFLTFLEHLGKKSADLGTHMDSVVRAWKSEHIQTRGACGFTGLGVLNLEPLFDTATVLGETHLKDMANGVNLFAENLWNPLIQGYAAHFPEHICPIQRVPNHSAKSAGPFLFTRAFYAAFSPAQGSSDEVKANNIGDILTCVGKDGSRSRIIVGKKALEHCWQCCEGARLNTVQSGNLGQQVGYVYLPKVKVIVLYASHNLGPFFAAKTDIAKELGLYS